MTVSFFLIALAFATPFPISHGDFGHLHSNKTTIEEDRNSFKRYSGTYLENPIWHFGNCKL